MDKTDKSKKNRNNKENLFNKRWFLVLFSLLLSVFVWVIIAGFVTQGENEVALTPQINYQENENTYKSQNLVIVGEKPLTAAVKVKANETVARRINASYVKITVDYSKVTGPGTYVLPLKIDKDSSSSFDFVGNASPTDITLTFEVVENKTLTINARADKVEAAPGYYKAPLQLSANTVDISGPSSLVDQVDQVVATVNSEEVRESRIHYTGVQLRLLDGNGNELDTNEYTLSLTEVEVTVPILEVREFPLTIEVTGYPQGFNVEWFKDRMEFSATTIQIAGDSVELDKITEISLGTIDVSEFEMNASFERTITLRKEFVNYSNLKSVTISFDTEDLDEKHFLVPYSNIQVINTPPGLTITPQQTNISVTLVGPLEVLARLLPENIAIQVDAYDVVAGQGGKQTIAARVMISIDDKVFALGTYQVVCEVSVD